jgi:hypothetical protein
MGPNFLQVGNSGLHLPPSLTLFTFSQATAASLGHSSEIPVENRATPPVLKKWKDEDFEQASFAMGIRYKPASCNLFSMTEIKGDI